MRHRNGDIHASDLHLRIVFETRFSADIKWRFNAVGGLGKANPSIPNIIKALSESPDHREIRVHDQSGESTVDPYRDENGNPIIDPDFDEDFADEQLDLQETYRVG